MVWTCCVPGCRINSKRHHGVSFFSFPRGREKEWLDLLKLDNVTNTTYLRICALHFPENEKYMAGSIRKLRKNAKPSIFEWCSPTNNFQLNPEQGPFLLIKIEDPLRLDTPDNKSEESMGRKCAIKSCKTRSMNDLGLSYFSVPKDPERRKLWEEATQTTINPLGYLCELHFKEEDIKRELIFYNPDKSVLGRANYLYPKLKEEAVPSLATRDLSTKESNPRKIPHSSTEVKDDSPKRPKITKVENTVYTELQHFDINLPSSWSKIKPLNSDVIVFANFFESEEKALVPYKEICVDPSGILRYNCLSKEVETIHETKLTSLENLELTILKYDATKLCNGSDTIQESTTSYIDIFGKWRDKSCPIILYDETKTSCDFCMAL